MIDAGCRDIITRLQRELPDMRPALQRAAKFILDHPNEIGLMPIRDAAAQAQVSPNTLVRLGQWLGYQTYDHLRQPFREALKQGPHAISSQARWLQKLGQGEGFAPLYAQMASANISNLKQMFSENDALKLEQAALLLLQAPQAYVLGSRSSYSLAHYFFYVGRMAMPNLNLVPRHVSAPFDDLALAGDRDVVLALSYQPYAKDTLQACEYAKSRGARLIAITDSVAAPLVYLADPVFVVPTQSPQYFASAVAIMALLETLLAFVVAQGGQETLDTIAAFEKVRDDMAVYWNEVERTRTRY
ncbi:MAG TPA: MurR/RpiR family transcriptional regulator [Candidatus Competibacteraceae bacterium]|nr:MurR/RpiR family transcriptional regulator [Gammaproteobacteria bacterium]HPF59306.1 MurR/RpiR family transcriptional regulator [Candidatus Competibacteraceae bacterium]HRY17146.1 MurR/RpiR family transcriptional regulator [Candidatus Competibacteraceae bacterium]